MCRACRRVGKRQRAVKGPFQGGSGSLRTVWAGGRRGPEQPSVPTARSSRPTRPPARVLSFLPYRASTSLSALSSTAWLFCKQDTLWLRAGGASHSATCPASAAGWRQPPLPSRAQGTVLGDNKAWLLDQSLPPAPQPGWGLASLGAHGSQTGIALEGSHHPFHR